MSRFVMAVVCSAWLWNAAPAESDTWSDVMKSAREAWGAGDYQRSKSLYTEAVAATEAFESLDPRRSEAKVCLAEMLLECGEFAKCDAICVELMDALEKEHGEKHADIAAAEKILTRLYLHLGIPQLADQHCTRGLKICEAIYGERHLERADFLALKRHVWNLDYSHGKFDGAQEAVDAVEAELGKNDERLIVALEALAGDCTYRWSPAQARRAVLIAEATYGNRHPVFGRCLSTLATALRHTRDFENSERVSKQAIEVLSASLGQEHPQLWAAFRNLASVERERGHSDLAETRYRDSIRLRFSTLSDSDLCHYFQLVFDSRERPFSRDADDGWEMYLTEMTRRGGEVIEAFLVKTIDSMREKYLQIASENKASDESENDKPAKPFVSKRDRMEPYRRNLELVTTLRRIQKQPDPLRISIQELNDGGYEFPEMPVLGVTIRNEDIELRGVGFKESGDYRSGRQARWRIEVRDSKGKTWSPSELSGGIFGGGIFFQTTLEPDAGWQTDLVMARFVETLEPGEYEVRVLYHDERTIVDYEFVTGLITCRSDPFKLVIKRRAIQITKEHKSKINELLKQLDDRQTPKIISGRYGPWAHSFVEPKSDYGRILTFGWLAVPSLIDELQRDSQTAERRAHLLALLYSITGENEPLLKRLSIESPVLGTFAMLEMGWSITSKREGADEPESSSRELIADPTTYEGDLEPKAQTRYIEQWKRFRQFLDVTD